MLQFECSDSGPAGYFLGFNIYRDRPTRMLYISQEHYFQSFLERFDLQDCNPARTPLPTGFDLFLRQTRNTHRPNTYHSHKLSVLSSTPPPSPVPTWLKPLASSLVSSANGTSPTGKWPSTCYATFMAQPISASCLTVTAASGSSSATLMPTGEVTWTLVGPLPATFSKSMAESSPGKAAVNLLLPSPPPKRNTWHLPMRPNKLPGSIFYWMISNSDHPRTRQFRSITTTTAASHSPRTLCTMTSRSTSPCDTTFFARKSQMAPLTCPMSPQQVTLRTC
jgi:hypothetical protein